MRKKIDWVLKEKELPPVNTKVLVTIKNKNDESYVVAAQYWNDNRFHTKSAFNAFINWSFPIVNTY